MYVEMLTYRTDTLSYLLQNLAVGPLVGICAGVRVASILRMVQM